MYPAALFMGAMGGIKISIYNAALLGIREGEDKLFY